MLIIFYINRTNIHLQIENYKSYKILKNNMNLIW